MKKTAIFILSCAFSLWASPGITMVLCFESVALANHHDDDQHAQPCHEHADPQAQSHPTGIPDCCLKICAKDTDAVVLSSSDISPQITSSISIAFWDTYSALNLPDPAAFQPLSAPRKLPTRIAQRPRYALFSTYLI